MKPENMDERLISYVNIFLIANRLATIANKGMHEITVKQWLPLIMLGVLENPTTLKELSEMCGISHQSTKQLVIKLEEKGYVVIKEDQDDKRSIRISVTEKFYEWNELYKERNTKFVYKFFSCLTKEETSAFSNIIDKLYNNLNETNWELFNYEL